MIGAKIAVRTQDVEDEQPDDRRALAEDVARACRATGSTASPRRVGARAARTGPAAARMPDRCAGRQPPSVRAVRWSRSSRPDPRVEEAVRDVDEEVDEDVDHGDDQDEALDDDVVAADDRLVQRPPDARQVERWSRSGRRRTNSAAELQADDRHDGQERVPRRVPDDDRPLPEALGPRGPDVVEARAPRAGSSG